MIAGCKYLFNIKSFVQSDCFFCNLSFPQKLQEMSILTFSPTFSSFSYSNHIIVTPRRLDQILKTRKMSRLSNEEKNGIIQKALENMMGSLTDELPSPKEVNVYIKDKLKQTGVYQS